MTFRVGLETTKIILTEVGKKWFAENYPQGFVYEYDMDGEFTLKSMYVIEGQAVPEVVCPLGIP
ncbi:MAG: hypothetical protein HWN68_19035, partial [Desulfobacterales bacterium]|nr:hypothetical protein [Desulfobacterales bacterium]